MARLEALFCFRFGGPCFFEALRVVAVLTRALLTRSGAGDEPLLRLLAGADVTTVDLVVPKLPLGE